MPKGNKNRKLVDSTGIVIVNIVDIADKIMIIFKISQMTSAEISKMS